VAVNRVSVVPPNPESDQDRALKDFWHVYDAHYQEVIEGTLKAAASDPEFAPLINAMPAEQAQENNRKSRELMRRAIMDGDTGPYLADLRVQGAMYARASLSFTAWFRLLGAFRVILLPHLLAAYGKSPDRLLAGSARCCSENPSVRSSPSNTATLSTSFRAAGTC
jgi:hypothetical protein